MKQQTDLKTLAAYAKRHGYTVEIKHDHIVAANNNGVIRTGSLATLKKVAGGVK
ncbi:MAG: hypothetical protein AB1763_09275 [Campylobacterota bacterium]